MVANQSGAHIRLWGANRCIGCTYTLSDCAFCDLFCKQAQWNMFCIYMMYNYSFITRRRIWLRARFFETPVSPFIFCSSSIQLLSLVGVNMNWIFWMRNNDAQLVLGRLFLSLQVFAFTHFWLFCYHIRALTCSIMTDSSHSCRSSSAGMKNRSASNGNSSNKLK